MDSAEEAAEAEPSPVSGRRQKLRRQRAPPRLQSEKSFSSPAPVVLRLRGRRWHSAGPRSVTVDRAPLDGSINRDAVQYRKVNPTASAAFLGVSDVFDRNLLRCCRRATNTRRKARMIMRKLTRPQPRNIAPACSVGRRSLQGTTGHKKTPRSARGSR